ncbi:Uncharacterised protein [Slackia heliotrinireducens]|uniref:Uncharacterized protein n=1 Tax=Slackia heliotrinireducens (strain ATCC 29202 / DSM 20476 / NCTC 11029 / RHS 1) TaxID=471855 RepID=C7N6N7_SLAHD|nr:hypothetical protein [Slackia heliotrinireducens]ACV22572.1 hypothetical protein Shel_15530 [Slackia heliotrinireducens DSM 20476]VEH01055.1 Uncharacterised protein [Slackia heliotrinireducens]
MIRGATVAVELRDWSATDRLGNHVEAYAPPEPVTGVLVAPGATADMDAGRPEGVRVALTLHFPKTWSGDLRGAKVTLGGPWAGTYRVVGEPHPYMDENCPTPWNMPVEVERHDG